MGYYYLKQAPLPITRGKSYLENRCDRLSKIIYHQVSRVQSVRNQAHTASPDLAEKHLKMAITVAPGNSHYYYLLGFYYSIKEQWAKAVTQFRKAIRLDPDNSEYERGLGWAMFNAGNRAEGLSHLYRSLELLSSEPSCDD